MTQTDQPTSCADDSQRELDELELTTRMERIGRKILVLSGKGGVGKSTVAANLAATLAAAGQKVGLLDVDLHGPSIPALLGLAGQRMVADDERGITPIKVSANLLVASIGLLLGSNTDAVIWRGPMKYSAIRQMLKDTHWGELDVLVIDSPPGTGDEPLAVAQMVGRGASAVVVTTPQDLAVADVRRSVSFCKTLGLEVAGIIENMSGLICPHCNETIDLFQTGGGEKLAAETGVPFLGRVPLDPQVVASGDTGRPFVEAFADSIAAKAFKVAVAPIVSHSSHDSASAPAPAAANAAPQPTRTEEGKSMKIAIPVAAGQLCMHFGHCEQFAIVEVDAAGSIVKTDYLTPPPHEPGVLPRWLAEQGANVIIAGGMGQRAQGLFSSNGIKVVVGAAAGKPEDVAAAYLAGTLQTGDNVCDH
jgi:Mrp family chromosome partitioning ATPase/predicted Fe-Mo cluster-binding NifX family protein